MSGGIDLSVNFLADRVLSAVIFGTVLARPNGLPVVVAAPLTIAVGAIAGGLNGFLITRLQIPALIVTLGSFSLFRGLAEGWTGGVDNFTNFPSAFLFLGQGYLPGEIPTQLPVFVLVDLVSPKFSGLAPHRTTIGRALFAIGFSPEGARYAGLPVGRRIGLVYVLSGVVSSLAAIIYVAHLGQAKADAGTGYELLAITAVVLGGTSIFGGRGSIGGTLLGLLAIAILQNGLRLADKPAELAGVLTGALLLLAIGIDRRRGRGHRPARPVDRRTLHRRRGDDHEERTSRGDLRLDPAGGPDRRRDQPLSGRVDPPVGRRRPAAPQPGRRPRTQGLGTPRQKTLDRMPRSRRSSSRSRPIRCLPLAVRSRLR